MNEPELTDAVARIAQRDPTFCVALARALLRSAALEPGKAGERASQLLSHLPRKRLQLYNHQYYEHVPIYRELLRELLLGIPAPSHSFIDWVWIGESFVLAVEVKTHKRPLFSKDQLERYQRAIRRLGKPHHGLLAITTLPPYTDELGRVRRRKDFLGAILWNNAEAELPLRAGRLANKASR